MLRTIRIVFLVILGLTLVAIAIANRDPVGLQLLPVEIDSFFGLSSGLELPLYAIIYGAIVAGVFVGFVWEWIREARIRAEADKAKREVSTLKNEVKTLRGAKKGSSDDVIALLE